MPEKDWFQIVAMWLGSAGGVTLIVLFLLKMWRYKHLDAANVLEKKAQIAKLKAETDLSIVAEYKILVASLREQLEGLKRYSDEIQAELLEEKRRCEELEYKLKEALRDITALRRKIDEIEKKINKQ